MDNKFKLLFFFLFFTFNCKPAEWAPVIAATTAESGVTIFGLAVNPTTIYIAGGVLLTKWIYNEFIYKFEPGKTPRGKYQRGSNKWLHWFGDNNGARKKHGFKRGDSEPRLNDAYDMIDYAKKNKQFVKEGQYVLKKVISKGVVLVVKVWVTAKAIDIGTLFLTSWLCSHVPAKAAQFITPNPPAPIIP